jgi:hypothetical protein
MSRVFINGENVLFGWALLSEIGSLALGPEASRELLCSTLEKAPAGELKEMLGKEVDTPVIVPLTREGRYERLYAICREMGGAVAQSLLDSGKEEEPTSLLSNAFQSGILSTVGIETLQYKYKEERNACFVCGQLIGKSMKAIFARDDEPDFQPPESAKILRNFWLGILSAQDNNLC